MHHIHSLHHNDLNHHVHQHFRALRGSPTRPASAAQGRHHHLVILKKSKKYKKKQNKKIKNHKTKQNQISVLVYNTVCLFYLAWQPHSSPRLTFSKPGIQNMCFQPDLNKTVSHATTTHLLTIRALQGTKLGFLSWPFPFHPYRIRFSVSASPTSHWFSDRVIPPATDPHTAITKGSQPIKSANTHQLHHSHTLNLPHSARISWLVIPLPDCCHMPVSWQ